MNSFISLLFLLAVMVCFVTPMPAYFEEPGEFLYVVEKKAPAPVALGPDDLMWYPFNVIRG